MVLCRKIIFGSIEDLLCGFLGRKDRSEVEGVTTRRGRGAQSRCVVVVLLSGLLDRYVRFDDRFLAFSHCLALGFVQYFSVRGRATLLALRLMYSIVREDLFSRGVVRAVVRQDSNGCGANVVGASKCFPFFGSGERSTLVVRVRKYR